MALALIVASILDIPSFLTLFIAFKSKRFSVIFLVALLAAIIGEVLAGLFHPAYEPMSLFFYRVAGQILLAAVIYTIKRLRFYHAFPYFYLHSYENKAVNFDKVYQAPKKREKINMEEFFADTKRLISFQLGWSERTNLEKAYTATFVIMVIGLLPFPYAFYGLLRVVVCIGLYVYLQEVLPQKEKRKWLMVALISLLVLYNPILPVHFGEQAVWSIINLATIIFLYRARRSLEAETLILPEDENEAE